MNCKASGTSKVRATSVGSMIETHPTPKDQLYLLFSEGHVENGRPATISNSGHRVTLERPFQMAITAECRGG